MMRAKKRSLSGPFTFAAMLALGLAVMGGMFIAANHYKGFEQFELPRRAIRIASIDLRSIEAPRAALEAIKSVQPDVVLVQNMRASDLAWAGELLGMKHVHGGDSAERVDVIYSTLELSEGKTIAEGDFHFGVRAFAKSERSKWLVASMHIPEDAGQNPSRQTTLLADAWKEIEGPPSIIGVAGCTLTKSEMQPIAPANSAEFASGESRIIVDRKSDMREISMIENEPPIVSGTVIELAAPKSHR